MELRERLTRSRAGQEDAKCGGRPRRPYQRPTGQEATAAAESPERPGARRLQPRKTALRLSYLLPVLVCLACALFAAVQGKKRSPPPPQKPQNPLNNPAYFKDLKKDIRDFLDGWPSAAFDAAHGHRIGGLNLNQGIPLSEFSLCSLLQVYLLFGWVAGRPEFSSSYGGNKTLRPQFSTYCWAEEPGPSFLTGDSNGFVTNYCNKPEYMPPECLLTGGSITLDVTDANKTVNHILVVLHPQYEPVVDRDDPFFIGYVGRGRERNAFLRAFRANTRVVPKEPALLYARHACIVNPFELLDLSASAQCVAGQLQASRAFNGAPPRAVALVPIPRASLQLDGPGLIVSKLAIERIPNIVDELAAAAAAPGLHRDENGKETPPQNILYKLIVLHPQPSSIPPGSPPP